MNVRIASEKELDDRLQLDKRSDDAAFCRVFESEDELPAGFFDQQDAIRDGLDAPGALAHEGALGGGAHRRLVLGEEDVARVRAVGVARRQLLHVRVPSGDDGLAERLEAALALHPGCAVRVRISRATGPDGIVKPIAFARWHLVFLL